MNKDNAKDFLPLVQALADGKTIQCLSSNNTWKDANEMGFVGPPSDYRIKPEPVERWGVVDKSGSFITTYGDEEIAAQQAGYYHGRYFLMREVV